MRHQSGYMSTVSVPRSGLQNNRICQAGGPK